MIFPQVDREIYRRNPLEEVICQLRFSQIFDIAVKAPADFQASIRAAYPEYAKRQPIIGGQNQIPSEILSVLQSMLPPGAADQSITHEFSSADSDWKVGLTQTFASLTTTNYERWEDFRTRLGPVMDALATYQIPYFTRIGLRYRNLIRRSALGLSDIPWSDLLAPHIAGELAAGAFPDANIGELQRTFQVRLDDGLQLRLQHGIVRQVGAETPEALFLIDTDIYQEERIDAADRDRIFGVLDTANGLTRNLFRWAIKAPLHDALEPALVQ